MHIAQTQTSSVPQHQLRAVMPLPPKEGGHCSPYRNNQPDQSKGGNGCQVSKKFGNAEWEQFSDLIHMATQQEAANLKVICENSRQSGGKYKTDVVVELPKAGVLSTIINQIKSDDKLKGLFEESQFKQAF